eukprot:Pgem_evm1s1044
MHFYTAFTTLTLTSTAYAKVAFQNAQIIMINDALNQYITENTNVGETAGCADPDAVVFSHDCNNTKGSLTIGDYPYDQLVGLLGTDGLRKVTVKKGYSAVFYSNKNLTGSYLTIDDQENACYDESIIGRVNSVRIGQHFECDKPSLPQQDAPKAKQLSYNYHALFGNNALYVSDVNNEVMISVTQTEKTKINTPLVGEGTPILADADGSVNCVDEAGKDIGFHCLMEPTANTPKNDQLRQNENANLCASEQNGDQVHCHASDTSDMYRYVMVDHINRNYNGKLDCKCGSPAGYVSNCDITTKNDVPRYESGKNNCKTGFKERSGSDRWIISDWGKRYLSTNDKAQQAYYAVDLGLNDNRRRSLMTETIEHNFVSGVCKRVINQKNARVGAISKMAQPVDMSFCSK